ncbi:hypothetical protein BDZ45DRAFT_671505 [Acephala macrosclerotiorum]|nr:hypothetical protein BDZ45DRAFT_671505 [Acephala macrosclerotiorum]
MQTGHSPTRSAKAFSAIVLYKASAKELAETGTSRVSSSTTDIDDASEDQKMSRVCRPPQHARSGGQSSTSFGVTVDGTVQCIMSHLLLRGNMLDV